MNSVTLKKFVVGAGMAVGVAAVAPDASAVYYILPGIACQGTRDTSTYSGTAFYANVAYDNAYCPILRHGSSSILGSANVRIYNPSEETTTCRIYACNDYGDNCTSDSVETTAGGDQLLSFDTSGLVEDAWGYFYIYCRVPTYGRIHGYRWAE